MIVSESLNRPKAGLIRAQGFGFRVAGLGVYGLGFQEFRAEGFGQFRVAERQRRRRIQDKPAAPLNLRGVMFEGLLSRVKLTFGSGKCFTSTP